MHDALGLPARRALGESNRQCTGTNRNGERCKRAAALGAFVCANHGAGAPQVKAAAQRRLMGLVDPAMEALLRALETAPACPTCGRSDSDRDPMVLKAAQLVLDRAGFHPAVSLQVTNTDEGPPDWGPFLTDEQVRQIGDWIAEAKVRMQADVSRLDDDVIDVEPELDNAPTGINHASPNLLMGDGQPEDA